MSWSGVPELIRESYFGRPGGPEERAAYERLYARVDAAQRAREETIRRGDGLRAAVVRQALEFTD